MPVFELNCHVLVAHILLHLIILILCLFSIFVEGLHRSLIEIHRLRMPQIIPQDPESQAIFKLKLSKLINLLNSRQLELTPFALVELHLITAHVSWQYEEFSIFDILAVTFQHITFREKQQLS